VIDHSKISDKDKFGNGPRALSKNVVAQPIVSAEIAMEGCLIIFITFPTWHPNQTGIRSNDAGKHQNANNGNG
jgi:hypothetical protein